MKPVLLLLAALFAPAGFAAQPAPAPAPAEAKAEAPVQWVDPYVVVSRLDDALQAAFAAANVTRLEGLLVEEFELVAGDGRAVPRAQLLEELRTTRYRRHEASQRTVRILGGETATVTARLDVAGERDGKPFEQTIWFTDVYVWRPEGWFVMLRQTSVPLPAGD